MGRTKSFNRDEVLDKAVKLFWEKGYADTSANDLVTQLGLSRSSLYDTFGDKRTLYLETLKRYQQQAARQFEKLESHYPDAKSLLRFLLESSIKLTHDKKDFKGCYMVNATIETPHTDSEVFEILSLNREVFESNFTRMIQQDMDHGLITNKASAVALANFVFSSISGFRIMVKSQTPQENLNKIIEVTLSVLD